jgi:hypothetical protein
MAATLCGCVYDPYTGSYAPCCSYYGNPYGYGYPYGYGGYRPPSYGPYGYPQGYPQGYQPSPYGAPPPGQPGAPALRPPPPQGVPGASAYPAQGGNLAERFSTANVTHDGRLTREQAAAGMPMVARNFDTIDVEHKGYVTLPEIRIFALEQRSAPTSTGG